MCHANSTKIAEKQLKSSSVPTLVFFKTPHPNRALSQLFCRDRGRRGAHTYAHTFLQWVFAYSVYRSPSSFLSTHTVTGRHGREHKRVSHDTVAELGHGSRGTTWRPPAAGAIRRCVQEGWGLSWGLTCLVYRDRHRGEESVGEYRSPPHPPGWEETVGIRVCRVHRLTPRPRGRADAQSRQKTYSV